MKRFFSTIIIMMIFFTSFIFAQTPILPSVGDGSAGEPYQIGSLENLYWIAADSTRWDKHYVQTSDIDAAATSEWFDGAGWDPIGHAWDSWFTGSYDGQDYTITELYIKRDSSEYVGLFGFTRQAEIKNVNLREVSIAGKRLVGALIGNSDKSTVTNCSSSGSICGESYIGGLIGHSYTSTINGCCSAGSVLGTRSCNGGLIGGSVSSSNVNNCYSSASATGSSEIGGLIGMNSSSTISKCYSVGHVSGNYSIGGLVGETTGSTINSFWDKVTSGKSSSAGGTGLMTDEMKTLETFTNAGWDFTETWDMNNIRNNGYPFLQWQTFPGVYIITIDDIAADSALVRYYIHPPVDRSYVCWSTVGAPTSEDFISNDYTVDSNNVWTSVMRELSRNTIYYVRAFIVGPSGISYSNLATFSTKTFSETGTEDDPYRISSLDQLEWISQHSSCWDKYFIQTEDINAAATSTWDDGAGWLPIGAYLPKRFTGSYDGQGHIIDSLFINRIGLKSVGLFGCTDAVDIKDLGLTNVNITGDHDVGGLVGISLDSRYTGSKFSNCYCEGDVKGNRFIGMLVGNNAATLVDCYTSGTATGFYFGDHVGGLTGANWGNILRCHTNVTIRSTSGALGGISGSNSGKISYCYSLSAVNGGGSAGGLVGANWSEINNSYSLGPVSGTFEVGGMVGVDNYGVIVNCYSTGLVNGAGRDIGGCVGLTYTESSRRSIVSHCFWDYETSRQTTSIAGEGLSTLQMKTKSTYTNADWDFYSIWDISGTKNDGYPHLFWESPIPRIKINAKTDLSDVAVNINYEMFYLGDPHPSQHGLCWNTTGDPSVADNKLELGPADARGRFDVEITDLSPDTKYYMRAFVTSDLGTFYCDTLSFSTVGTSIGDPIPMDYSLEANYPNPFNPVTTLQYALPEQVDVRMEIFDLTGRKVRDWTIQGQTPGIYRIVWNSLDNYGNTVPSGIYIYRLKAGDFIKSNKMVLMK